MPLCAVIHLCPWPAVQRLSWQRSTSLSPCCSSLQVQDGSHSIESSLVHADERTRSMTENKGTVERYMDGFNKSAHEQISSCLTDDIVCEASNWSLGRLGFRKGNSTSWKSDSRHLPLYTRVQLVIRKRNILIISFSLCGYWQETNFMRYVNDLWSSAMVYWCFLEMGVKEKRTS